jgi:hypothetical protein
MDQCEHYLLSPKSVDLISQILIKHDSVIEEECSVNHCGGS